YYLGSNVSYNVKKMVENGYLVQERSAHDRRSVRVKVSEKGLNLCDQIETLHQRHITSMSQGIMTQQDLELLNQSLHTLERFWADNLAYGNRVMPDGVSVSAA
ncbi:MAG TPA: MarR family transcriptional regulator, partial [Sneathiellales bacterium]|nr:MarR family transcriptional regulator [Sneathiellales bacterium]